MVRPIPYSLAAGLLAATAVPAAAAWHPRMPKPAVTLLPPERPAEFGGRSPTPPAPEGKAEPAPQPAPAPPTPPAAAAPTPAPTAGGSCLSGLAAQGIRAEAGTVPAGSGCSIEEPVRILAITGHDGAIELPEKPLVSCRLATPLATYLRGIAAPVLASDLGSRLARVQTGPGFECRPRNHVAGAKPSAHGVGLAIDIAGFELADGRKLMVAPGSDAKAEETWRQTFGALRVAACGWFLTVLGPGSDPYHATHMHVDIQQHGSSDRYRICQ